MATITIADVAAASGMSLPAVSQILNHKGSYRAETRERVIAAARRLGYHPNANARAMVNRSFGCYALVLSSRPSSSLLPQGLAEALDEALSRRGLHLILARLPDEQLTDPGYVPKILNHVMADGLIINYNAGVPQAMVELIATHQVPAVWLNSLQTSDAIRPDDHGAGAAAARLLLAAGHRRLGWVDFTCGPAEEAMHYSFAHRRDGFRVTALAAGVRVQHLGQDGGVPRAERLDFMRGILTAGRRPTALACYGSHEAEVVCAAALAEGLEIPRDLSLVTIADRVYAFAGREIDTLCIDGAAIGRLAVERLAALVAGGSPQPPDAMPLEHLARGCVAPVAKR